MVALGDLAALITLSFYSTKARQIGQKSCRSTKKHSRLCSRTAMAPFESVARSLVAPQYTVVVFKVTFRVKNSECEATRTCKVLGFLQTVPYLFHYPPARTISACLTGRMRQVNTISHTIGPLHDYEDNSLCVQD